MRKMLHAKGGKARATLREGWKLNAASHRIIAPYFPAPLAGRNGDRSRVVEVTGGGDSDGWGTGEKMFF